LKSRPGSERHAPDQTRRAANPASARDWVAIRHSFRRGLEINGEAIPDPQLGI